MSRATEIIQQLGLQPHPEGGHYREIFRAPPDPDGRSTGTAIYYLLQAGEASHWHRIDAAEVWHFYAGDPLELSISANGQSIERHVMGSELAAGQTPVVIVPPHTWQAAQPLGAYALVGCTVSPGFEFDSFELAPAAWRPGPS